MTRTGMSVKSTKAGAITGLLPGEKPSRAPPSFWDGNFKVNWLSTFIIMFPPVAVAGAAYAGVELQLKTFLVAVFFYLFNGFGITVGYHRCFSHCSFKCPPAVQWLFAFAGAGALQGSAKWWARNHRIHHRYIDTDLDPYNAKRGFWFSHMGWLVMKQDYENLGNVDCTDLNINKIMRQQHVYYFPISMVSALVLPTLICGLGWGDWLGGYFYAALAKAFFIHHCTFFINSLAHSSFMGAEQTVSDAHTSHDSMFCALLTFGEGYHNFHHEFANDYRNGLMWYHYDPTKWIIRALEFAGLASGLVRTPDAVLKRSQTDLKKKKLDVAVTKVDKKIADLEKKVAAPIMMTEQEMLALNKGGRKLMVVGDYVVDLEKAVPTGNGYTHESKNVVWYNAHPGGRKILDEFIGKDATAAMTGGIYKHHEGAFNLIAHLRVASVKRA